MTFNKLILAAAAALAVGAASAAPLAKTPGQSLGDNPAGVSFLAFANANNVFSFTLVETAGPEFVTTFDVTSTLVSLFVPVNVTGVTVLGTSFAQTINPAPTTGSVTFFGLTAGDYTIAYDLTSSTSGLLTGTVSTSMNVTPVPEAETYALALAGLGVVGLVAARRRKV